MEAAKAIVKIRFVTRDALVCIQECVWVDRLQYGMTVNRIALRTQPNFWDNAEPEDMTQLRTYQFQGEMEDGIPTLQEIDASEREPVLVLTSGVQLNLAQCQLAMDEAMRIIEVIGTTATRFREAEKWMKKYYSNRT